MFYQISAIFMLVLVVSSACIVSVPDEVTPTPTPTGSYVDVTIENITPVVTPSFNATLLNKTIVIPNVTPDFALLLNITTPTTVPPTETTKPRRTPKPTIIPVITMNESQPYLTYRDDSFSINYPSNWTYEETTVPFQLTLLNARNAVGTTSKQVTFHGQDITTSFTVLVSDLIVPGTGQMVSDVEACIGSITARYPDTDGRSAIGDYEVRYTNTYHTPYVQFKATLPPTSKAYPLAYTERDLVSYNHFYTFRFATPGVKPELDYIREAMFYSIQTEESSKPTGWIG